MIQLLLDLQVIPASTETLPTLAADFCSDPPFRIGPYAKRNWGGPLHSLCSYQGKLKPSIAHFLISSFTSPGQRVLDPLAGVGTIPLEARRQGRIGIASDLSPLAASVCHAKLEPVGADDIWVALSELDTFLKQHANADLTATDVDFGLNGPIREYFHEDTLREIVLARDYFLSRSNRPPNVAHEVVKSSLLHILHGNRPYALSRRSHPVTPFAPTGPTIYRPVIGALKTRLNRVLPHLMDLGQFGPDGVAYQEDFRNLPSMEPVDAVITSPPFSKSVRFWSSNWLRLWFSGWSPTDFKEEPSRFLEVEQKSHFAVYGEFAATMAGLLKPGGLLIMHLGETAKVNMAEAIAPFLAPHFEIRFAGRESVVDTESHGLTDKGATVAHWFVFATSRI